MWVATTFTPLDASPSLTLVPSNKEEITSVTSVQFLHNKCITALKNYACEAQKTCDLLGAKDSAAPSLDRLLSICAQTQAENSAHELYVALRSRLLEELHGSGLSNSPRNPAEAVSSL